MSYASITLIYPNKTTVKMTGDSEIIKQLLKVLDGVELSWVPAKR